ncbi:MAG: CobW family GTP-binding protein [Desulfobacterales bacterium]|nr:CobW family GTP-binding protein [Desulfobacterales bacterium]MDX2511571.1 CobW family GTP-binding protein [Desulfobacterales bacterium]
MPGTTAVYLISGFLGSGKTTFLNRVIQGFPSDRKLMILMNEFGDMGVDGSLVENDDLSMLEISKGSIFCVCVKTDFIKGLMNIAQKIQPDVLIIEATGVANPSDLKRDLKLSLFQDRFHLIEQFCLIDAANFKDAYDTFTSVEKQLESATVFIINKIDEADDKIIQKVKQIVRKHHPGPDFFETTYADIPLGKFLPEVIASEIQDIRQVKPVSEEALEAAIDKLLQDPAGSMTPPDRLVSGSFVWKGMHCRQFEEMMKLIPDDMVRAKGVFETSTGVYLFNWVMGRGQFKEIVQKERMASLMNQIVFIGPPEVMEQMGRIDFGGMMQHVSSRP